MNRRNTGATNALLQRVNSQLRGERLKDEDDDLNAYISSLTQKTTQQRKSVNFEDLGSSLSISSDIDEASFQTHQKPTSDATSRFLKKKGTDLEAQPSPGAKFLKKPQTSVSPTPAVNRQLGHVGGASSSGQFRSSQASITPSSGRNSRAGSVIGSSQFASPTQRANNQSSVLNKAASIANKVSQRTAVTRNVFTLDTDSDDISTPRVAFADEPRPGSASSDSVKIGRDGGKFLKKKPEERPSSPVKKENKRATTPESKTKKPSAEQKAQPFVLRSSLKYSTNVVLSSEEESMAEFIDQLTPSEVSGPQRAQAKKNKQTKTKIVSRSPSPPVHRTPSPDSKPPAVRRSPSPGSKTTPRRTPSPKISRRSPSPRYARSRSRSSDGSNVGDSLTSEIADDVRASRSSVSSDEGFKVNLMDIDMLEPVFDDPEPVVKPKQQQQKNSSKSEETKIKKTQVKTKKQSKQSPRKGRVKEKRQKSPDFFGSLGLHTVEELLGSTSKVEEPESLASEVSEVKTEPLEDKSEALMVLGAVKQTGPFVVLGTKKGEESRSEVVSEIKSHGTVTPPKQSYTDEFEESIQEDIGGSRQRSVIKTASEIKTRHSGDDTADDYSSDTLDSDTESIATVSRTSRTSDRTVSDSYTSYAESATYSRSLAIPKKPRGKHAPAFVHKSVEVQTEEPGLTYRWNSQGSGFSMPGIPYGLGFVDPTPIATHVVSPDALEALTAYNPCMIALHDMLKQQLQLTQEFVQAQKIMYKSHIETVESNYKYTTLEETKQYIRKHRRKKLTFEEALKMVEAEMR